MPARLKVYATRIGFHDAVVAAPSQKAALAAWDVRENLFAQGTASVTEDKAAVDAALARPGVVLRRPAGSTEPYGESPAAPQVPKLKRPGGAAKLKAVEKPAPPPDRRALDAAEKALLELDREQAKGRRDLDDRRRALEAEADAFARDFADRRRKLEAERDRARRAYDLSRHSPEERR